MTVRGCIENDQMSALILASLLAIAAPLPAVAQEVHAFNVSAQDPASAIRAFGAQAEIQILASAEDLKGKKFNPISGDISTENALNHLLAGTGLAHRYVGDRAVALVSNSAAATQPSTSSTQIVAGSLKPPSDSVLVAQANTTGAQSQSGPDSPHKTDIPSSSSKASEKTGLEEIVVTATKRETTVQNTPMSLTAVSGANIEARGLAGLAALLQSVPGVSMRTNGPGQTEFEMRGMASTGGNSPTVGFYLDDTPLTAPTFSNNGKVVIDPNLYDLNRVEVLRGPQGTLYGSGSMGGTIKIVPNAPNPAAFDASAEAIVGATDGGGFNHGENAMVNLPFAGGTAALRIVGSESHESGWIDRIVIANGEFPLETNNDKVRGNVLAAPVAANYKDVNDTDLTAVRVGLLWKPSDQLSITPSYFYQRIQQDGSSNIDSNPDTNAHYQPFDTPEPFSDRFDLASLNIKYALDAFDLSSTSSYWTRDEEIAQDGAESFQWGLGLPSFYTSQGGIGPSPGLEDDWTKQTSEELRLTSSGNSAFQWLVGYFYSDFEADFHLSLPAPGAVSLFGTGNLYSQVQPNKIIQNSFFGEVSYQLTPQLKAAAGLRRYSYDSSVNLSVSGAVSQTGSDAVANYSAPERDQGLNPKFDLSYEASENLLFYATISKGFRPGGGDEPIPTSGRLGDQCEANLQANRGTTQFVPSPSLFAPDSVWSYELGEKMEILEKRLTINSAVYFENWSGIQQVIPLPCGYNYQANAGDAHIYGSEVEVNAMLAQGLVISVNAGYTHATLVTATVLNAGISPGSRIQDVPDWTSSQSIAYRHGMSNQLAFTARIENDYVGTRTDTTYAINHLPSYDLTQVRVGVESDRWSAVLFAKNVFNERVLLNDVTMQAINLPTYNRVTVSQPLTVGIDLNYHFGR
jgi:iron complex outermembrane recepter protein